MKRSSNAKLVIYNIKFFNCLEYHQQTVMDFRKRTLVTLKTKYPPNLGFRLNVIQTLTKIKYNEIFLEALENNKEYTKTVLKALYDNKLFVILVMKKNMPTHDIYLAVRSFDHENTRYLCFKLVNKSTREVHWFIYFWDLSKPEITTIYSKNYCSLFYRNDPIQKKIERLSGTTEMSRKNMILN